MIEEQIELSEKELAILHEFERARHLGDLVRHPGWGVYMELRDIRIAQLKEQFLNTPMDKDALWAAQIRLSGIIAFANTWHEGIFNAIDCLEPAAMQRIIEGVKIDPTTLDGDLYGSE